MKYTKLITGFLFLNLVLVFLMIFIANKTRELEKNNQKIKIEISKISDDIKINKIELITHKNSNYLTKLYSLYFSDQEKRTLPNIISLNQFSKDNRNIKLIKTNK